MFGLEDLGEGVADLAEDRGESDGEGEDEGVFGCVSGEFGGGGGEGEGVSLGVGGADEAPFTDFAFGVTVNAGGDGVVGESGIKDEELSFAEVVFDPVSPGGFVVGHQQRSSHVGDYDGTQSSEGGGNVA